MVVLTRAVVRLLLSLQMYTIVAYELGAPPDACDTMTPLHYGYSPQTNGYPYVIRPSPQTYCPNNEVNITLTSKSDGLAFKGFLCQARTATDADTTSGSLPVPMDSTVGTKNNCPEKASLTHSDSSLKTAVHFIWVPDSTKTDSIFISCTIVQQQSTYWVKQSLEIEYAGTDRCTPEGDVKGLPTSCTDPQTCGQAVTNAICDTDADADGECVCPSHMKIAHPTHTYCSLKVLGDACSSNNDCHGIPMSVCNVTCMCPTEYKQQSNQTYANCVIRALNDACTSDAQCTGTADAKCTGGQCKVDEMATCSNDTDCTGTDGNKCVEGQCTSALNDACTSDEQCTGTADAKCTGGQCKVDEMATCSNDTDCTGTDGNKCVEGQCTSGTTKAAILSFMLVFGSFVFSREISIF